MTAPAIYLPAPEVAAVAEPLIVEHHPDLAVAPIVYVFRQPALRSRNRLVLGRALRVLGLHAFLTALASGEAPTDIDSAAAADHGFYVMEVARPEWLESTAGQQTALVDHELCHFYVHPESGELKIRGHDVEEFVAVAARHGAWTPDLAVLVEACATSA